MIGNNHDGEPIGKFELAGPVRGIGAFNRSGDRNRGKTCTGKQESRSRIERGHELIEHPHHHRARPKVRQG
jgi:hypothetical protein